MIPLILACFSSLFLGAFSITFLGVASSNQSTNTVLFSFDSSSLQLNVIANYSGVLIWDGGVGTCLYDRSRKIVTFVDAGRVFYQVSAVDGTLISMLHSPKLGIYELGVNEKTGDVFAVGPPLHYDPVSSTLAVYKVDFSTKSARTIGTIANGLGRGTIELAIYASATNTFYFQPFTGPIIGFNTQLKMPVASILPLNNTQIACVSDSYIYGLSGGERGHLRSTIVRINLNTYAVEPIMNTAPYNYFNGAVYDESSNTLYFFAYVQSAPSVTYLVAANLQTKTFTYKYLSWGNLNNPGSLTLQNIWIA